MNHFVDSLGHHEKGGEAEMIIHIALLFVLIAMAVGIMTDIWEDR